MRVTFTPIENAYFYGKKILFFRQKGHFSKQNNDRGHDRGHYFTLHRQTNSKNQCAEKKKEFDLQIYQAIFEQHHNILILSYRSATYIPKMDGRSLNI